MINPHVRGIFHRNRIVANDLLGNNVADNYIRDGRHVQSLPGNECVGADADDGGIAANFGTRCEFDRDFEVDDFFAVSL